MGWLPTLALVALTQLDGTVAAADGRLQPRAQPEVETAVTPGAAKDTSAHAALALGVGTDYPISMGVHLRGEAGPRIQFGTSVGLLPRPYLTTINRIMVATGRYDETAARFISAAMHNALVWRTQLGFRPFRTAGFYFAGGYTFVGLGGSLTGSEVLAALEDAPPLPSGVKELQLDATAMAHQAGAELGWRWRLPDLLACELALGGFWTVSAGSRLSLRDSPRLSVLAASLLSEGENFLNRQLKRNVRGGHLSFRLYFEVL